MFEACTEKARRVIFFARHEASELGGGAIEPQHLLLGLMREDRALITQFCNVTPPRLDELRKRIRDSKPQQKLPASLDMLSRETKEVLRHSAEESQQLKQKYIGTEHLLLGLLRMARATPFQVLTEHGIDLHRVREALRARIATEANSAKARSIEELRKLSANAHELGNAIIRTSARIDRICEQLTDDSIEAEPEVKAKASGTRSN